MKQRFSYLDLRLITAEVETNLKDAYLQNIYSLENSPRHFLLKFDAPPNETGKRFLIVDPGMRCHLTKFQHAPTPNPSFFVQKLRKYLRNRRATDFWVQPGSRLLAITFNGGQFKLVLELFSGGNIILLDENHKILTLYRVVRDVGPNHQNYQIGETYALDTESCAPSVQLMPSRDELSAWVAKDKLGKALYTKVSDPSSSLLEYCLRKQNLDPKQKLDLNEDKNSLDRVELAVKEALARTQALIEHQGPVKGYILRDERDTALEFEPFIEYFELVHPAFKTEECATYNSTVDSYFGALLSDRGVNKVEQLHELAEMRLQAARNERKKRVGSLEQQQELNAKLGNAILENAETVDAAIGAVKSLVDQGVDWGDAGSLIALEKEKGNPVAQIIDNLNLVHHKVELVLGSEQLKVSVHIDRSAFANARDYFEIRKTAGAKIEKTEQHADKALKSAEIKIKRDLEANLVKHLQASNASKLHAIRQTHWFEKFWWFLTSTKHLVIGAREEMQRNLLLRRYFHAGDVAMTSDATDATLVIIKNPEKLDIAPQTYFQAAAFVVASSAKAWEAKAKSPSWFFTRDEVPKTNKKGDPISMADFRALKNRNLVPPTPIDMGLTLLWQIETPESDEEADNCNALKLSSSDSKNANANENENEDDDEDFPDTQVDSDDEFPDTNVDSDAYSECSANESSDDSDASSTDELSDSADPPVSALSEQSLMEHKDEQNGNSSSEINSSENEEFEDSENLEPESKTGAQKAVSPISAESSREGTPAAALKKVRGGKKKLRRYMDQDDEDRQAAMERLGTLKGLERKAAEKENIEQARKIQQEREQQRRERRRQIELDLINEFEEPESQPTPTDFVYKYSEDEPIVAAVPMFAPWSSIQQAQYKAKIVFGSLKKGKASNELLRVILNTSPLPPSDREKLLVEAIKPVDVQQAIAVSRLQLATSVGVKNGKPGAKSNQKGGAKKSGGKKKK